MKILYISDFYYTDSSGAKTSARAHLNTLNNLYGANNVRMVALLGPQNPENVDKNHILLTSSRNKIFLLWNCLCGYSTYLDQRGILKIVRLIKQEKIDIVFVDNSIFGKLIKKIKKIYPTVLVLAYYHDVKAKLARQWLSDAPIYRKPVMLAMLSNEKITAEYADVNFVLGNREEKFFSQAYKKRPEAHLSVYMDIQLSDEFYIKSCNNKKKLLFFGGYYLPNVHGIDWFIKEVYPKLNNNIEVIVAGRGMDKLKEKQYPPNITIMGYVESIEKLYRDADIVISPIFEGGGMKVKVAEAMAFGKVVVGSKESYEGYQEKIPNKYWNKFFYYANTADEFVSKIQNALALDEKKHHFNPEVREIYESGFSESYAEKTISEVINKYMGENK